MIIHQGDSYYIPFKITVGETVITPNNCVDVRIRINGKQKSLVNNELSFNSTGNCFLYKLTEKMSFHAINNDKAQVAVKFEDGIVYSDTQTIPHIPSIINGEWT